MAGAALGNGPCAWVVGWWCFAAAVLRQRYYGHVLVAVFWRCIGGCGAGGGGGDGGGGAFW